MLERSFLPELVQLPENPHEDFLGQIVELMVIASKARGGGKHATFVPADQLGKRMVVAPARRRHERLVGRFTQLGHGLAIIGSEEEWQWKAGGGHARGATGS
jgi:hypothetical protein